MPPPVGVRIIKVVEVPTPVGGQLGHGVPAVDQQLPQVLRRGDPAREAARHTDDRDRVDPFALPFPLPNASGFELTDASARPHQIGGHLVEVAPQLRFVRHRPPCRPRDFGLRCARRLRQRPRPAPGRVRTGRVPCR